MLNVRAGVSMTLVSGRTHAKNKVEIGINMIYCENPGWHLSRDFMSLTFWSYFLKELNTDK